MKVIADRRCLASCVVEPVVHRDPRGFFLETWREERYRAAGIAAPFVQDNHSRSTRGTLRGLHAQLTAPAGQAGARDRGRDLRRRGRHPPAARRPSGAGWANGSTPTTSASSGSRRASRTGSACCRKTAQVEYKCTAYYDRDDEIAISWSDPDLAIEWPIAEPLVSAKDRDAPRLRDLEALLERHAG